VVDDLDSSCDGDVPTITFLCHVLPQQNFYPGLTSVTIGDVPCTSVQLTDSVSLGSLQCTAPSGPGIGDVRLRVDVVGGGNASTPFLYDAPAVTGVSMAAAPADNNVVIRVTGTNLGLRNSATSPDPVVYIGDRVCVQPLLLSSTTVQCTALASPVGGYLVTGKAFSAPCNSGNPTASLTPRAHVPWCSVPQRPNQYIVDHSAPAMRRRQIWAPRHRVWGLPLGTDEIVVDCGWSC
jgi:hypothetical protein